MALGEGHATKTDRVEVQPTNVAEANCGHGLCRAERRRISGLQTEARLVTLHEAELSYSASSFPTRCLFGLAFA